MSDSKEQSESRSDRGLNRPAAGDEELDRRLADVPVPEGMLDDLLRIADPPNDEELDRQLADVPVPAGMRDRLFQIADPLNDEELDRQLNDLPVPPRMLERLLRICEPRRAKINLGQWAAAAALMIAVSGGYAGAMIGLVASAFSSVPPVETELVITLTSSVADDAVLDDPLQTRAFEAVVIPWNDEREMQQAEVVVELHDPDPPSDASFDSPSLAFRSEAGADSLLPFAPLNFPATILPWHEVEHVLGSAADDAEDHLPEMEFLPRETPRGIAAPLRRGWDRPWFHQYDTHPALWLDRNPDLRFCEVPLVSETHGFRLAQRRLAAGLRPVPGQVRVEDFLAALEYDFPAPKEQALAMKLIGGRSPFAGRSQPSGGGGQFSALLQIGIRAGDVSEDLRPACRLTILLDRSRSMVRGARWDMACAAITETASRLGPADRLNLVVFNERAECLLTDVGRGDRDHVSRALDSVEAEGSTNIAAGLRMAYGEAMSRASNDGLQHRVVLV
ncbi:MAG: VWA domain-containing protein, partial [Planctomycetales bacterium]